MALHTLSPQAEPAEQRDYALPTVLARSRSPAPRQHIGPRAELGKLALAILPPLVPGLAVLFAWQAARATNAIPELLLPAPTAVLRSFWLLLTVPELRASISTTVMESLGGCLIAALVALPLGYAIARNSLLARAVQPYIAASQAIPAVAIAPLIVLVLGYGLGPLLTLCALIVFFPLVVTTALGLRSIDPEVLDAARVDGAHRWAMLWHIELPLALPSILAGLRTSLTLSITGAVVGEFVIGGGTGGNRGLAQLLVQYLSAIDGAGVFATVLALALLASLYYGIARLCEHYFSYLEAQ